MSVLTGIQNALCFVVENWTAIIVIFSLIVAIIKKVISFFNKSKEERISIAKKQIRETMLNLITNVESDYSGWVKAGAIKRSKVISQIFDTYPILSKIVDQDGFINWIDDVIDESLDTMNEIFEEQPAKEEQSAE